MADVAMVVKGDPEFDLIMKVWIAEKKPGYVVLPGGQTYRVFQLSDEEIKFQPQGTGVDQMYGTRSTTSLSK